MKTLFKNPLSLLIAMLFMFGGMAYANTNFDHPDNMVKPVDKKGKFAKLDVSSLPMDQEITVRVRDYTERLVDEFRVKNTGQQYVLMNFNSLKPGVYSLNVMRGENDIVRKIMNVHWNQVAVRNVVNLQRDNGQETRWPLYLVR